MRCMNLYFLVSVSVILMSCTNTSVTSSLDSSRDTEQVSLILKDLDNMTLTTDQQLRNYTRDVVLLAPEQNEIRGLEAMRAHLDNFGADSNITMQHQIVELDSYADIVIVQGQVIGQFTPNVRPTRQLEGVKNAVAETFDFRTKNIVIFKRTLDKELKIWKVIYNSAPKNN